MIGELSGEFALSVPQIDREHGEVLELARDLRAVIDLGRPPSELRGALEALASSVGAHFASEEKLMRSSGYPGLQGHIAEHERLLRQFKVLEQEFAAGTIRPGGALALFVDVWTQQHIQGPDRRFAEYLKARAA